VLFLLACHAPFLETRACEDHFSAPGAADCTVPGWDDRDYTVVLPDGYDGSTPVPLVLALHGGGGNRESAARVTCTDGESDASSCLHVQARARGWAVVFPDGVPKWRGSESRSWNAGGGEDGWRCVGGTACEEGSDDVQYFRDLLTDLESRVNVDVTRIVATGLSNGGAMSHRLACDLADQIAAVAPFGGGLQLTTTGTCAPSRSIPILYTHGVDDPCWPYAGGATDCPIGKDLGNFVSAERTLDDWKTVRGCKVDPTEEALPDTKDDGTSTTRLTWEGCGLTHLRVEGGGHTWPSGYQYLGERTIGVVPQDWGNEVLWEFFEEAPGE
jgi:polyhydroxybutyrate depolymerase